VLDRPGRAGIFGMHDLTCTVHAPADLRADEPDIIVTRLEWSVRGTPIESHASSSSKKEQKVRMPCGKPAAEGIIRPDRIIEG
jgi:hypothetical protein